MSAHDDRLPPIPPESMTPAQQEAAAALVQGRRGALFGPFVPMLRSPEMLNRAQRLGEYLRYESTVPIRLRELAILLTARHFRQAYEWHVHAPAGAQAGLGAAVIAAIAADRRPESMREDETVVYEFCVALHRTHEVPDAIYAAALARLGEGGVMDLCAICGYYAMLALIMNTARTPLPEGASAPW